MSEENAVKPGIVLPPQHDLIEIKKSPYPPQAVKEVMAAALLLVGENEATTKDWGKCQKLCTTIRTPKRNSFINQLKEIDFTTVHPEIASRAKEILKDYDTKGIHHVCLEAVSVYSWVVAVCDQVLSKVSEVPPPASIERQREIFGQNVEGEESLEEKVDEKPTS